MIGRHDERCGISGSFRVKILQIISTVNPNHGGPSQGLLDFAAGLTRRGHDITIVTLDAPDAPWVLTLQQKYKVVALGPSHGKYAYCPSLKIWLVKNAKLYEAALIHGLWQYHGYCASRVLYSSGVPYWVFCHGMLDPWFKHRFPFKHFKKSVYWWLAEHSTLRRAKGVLFTAQEEAILARQSFRPYTVNEVVVNYGTRLPAEAAIENDSFLQQFPELRGQRIVLFLARIHPKKGCDLLIEAFARVAEAEPRLRLVMAGPDQVGMRKGLEAQCVKLGISDRVCWPGMLRGQQKWAAFRAAEVFILPSHQENFGIAIAESLAMGIPVLISNKVNIWREVEEAKAGFVAPDDLAGTQQLLQCWMDLPETGRAALRNNAIPCYAKYFDIDHGIESFHKLAQESKVQAAVMNGNLPSEPVS